MCYLVILRIALKILSGMECPGVYVVARSPHDISEEKFSLRKEIIYVGMTNARSGLRGRLRAFDRTLKGFLRHGGADRVRYKYHIYTRLSPKLYVAISPWKCDVTSKGPADLRKMGEIAKFEYLCFAEFVEKYGKLPKFNRMDSLKYSTHWKQKLERAHSLKALLREPEISVGSNF